MPRSTWGLVVLLAAILGGESVALVRVVVARTARARPRTVVDEPSPTPPRETGEASRQNEWGDPPSWPAVPAPAISEAPPQADPELEPLVAESAAVQAARRVVTTAVAGHPGTTLTSLECAPEPCGAVVEANDLGELRAAILDVTAAYIGHVDVDVRERDDPARGHVFEAAVAIGTPTAETVTALDSEF